MMSHASRWSTLPDAPSLVRCIEDSPAEVSTLSEGQWRSLVELVTHRVQTECSGFGAEDWRRCGDAYVGLLARAVAAGAYSPHEALVRRLNLTAVCLRDGSVAGGRTALQDAELAVTLAVDALPDDVPAVLVAATRWRDLPRTEILRLRRVKNVLTPTLAIAARSADRRVEPWKAVYDELP